MREVVARDRAERDVRCGAEALPISGLLWLTLVRIVKPATLKAPALICPTIDEPGKLSPTPWSVTIVSPPPVQLMSSQM